MLVHTLPVEPVKPAMVLVPDEFMTKYGVPAPPETRDTVAYCKGELLSRLSHKSWPDEVTVTVPEKVLAVLVMWTPAAVPVVSPCARAKSG